MRFAPLLALAALDAAGYSVIAPVVPEIGERTGAGPATLGLLVAMFGLGQLAGFPVAGALVKRRPARWTIVAALALLALGDLGFIAGDDLGTYFVARAVQGVGAGALWIGITFAVLERYPDEAYRRLALILGAYSVGGVAGPALGGAGGVAVPFALHLALVAAACPTLLALGRASDASGFASDRSRLRGRGFALSASGILLAAVGYGAIDGVLPLHFATRLSQAEIAALLVTAAVGVGVAAALAGRIPAHGALALAVFALPMGITVAAASNAVVVWTVALFVAAIGLGTGETGALGVLLDEVGARELVLAMVVWSQVWSVGYLAGPVAAGAAAERVGFGAVGAVAAVAALPVLGLLLRSPR